MKTLAKTILAVLATGMISCALFSQQAQADPQTLGPVTGSITFGGSVELDTASAGNATAVTAWHGFGGIGAPVVVDRDGSFALVNVLAPVAFATPPWYFFTGPGNPLAPGPIVNFWSVGGFSFELTASSIFAQGGNPAGVIVTGYGWITGNGFDATYGTWSFSTQDPGVGQPARFSFSAASGAVPDSGSTVAFLGLALVGVEALRRRMRTAR
jgi:hypothetical protein